MLLITLYPHSRWLYLFCYITNAGILPYSIYGFGNSIIFHLIDKMTDLGIHLFPFITIYNIHWNIRGTEESKNWGFIDPESYQFGTSFMLEFVLVFHIFYGLWAIVYYAIILWLCKERIKSRNYWTLLQMQTDKSRIAQELKEKHGAWA